MADLSKDLRLFYELARVVATGPYAVDELLERVTTELRQAFDLERALLAVYNPDERGVHAVVQQNVDWPGDEWLPLEWFPFLVEAVETRSAMFVRDALEEEALPERIAERFGVTSVVAVPLVTEGRIIGFFVADRAGTRFELSPADLQLLSAVGSVAAVFVERADQYERLESALAEVRRLDVMKSEFVSIASHELRTPIAVVHGVAATLHLRGHELDAQQILDLRRVLYEHTLRLTDLTEQLLDLSRLDAGALKIRPETFAPCARCQELVQRVAPERATEVEVEIDPELEVTTDPHAFDRVVTNLITNALRYGHPPVRVSGDRNGGVRIAVEDRGPGVDPAFAPVLFERFTRSETSKKGPRGAGLGLAIAHSYAEAIGGDLAYEPALPKGARFVLRLPG